MQADLDAKLARLAAIQRDLRAERARLARLRARLAEARVILARRLVDLYKADNPDVLTVVLNADGFADLLERSEFARRVGAQDRRIIIDGPAWPRRTPRRPRSASTDLEDEARAIAAVDPAAAATRWSQVKDTLVDRRDQYASVRAEKQTALVLRARAPRATSRATSRRSRPSRPGSPPRCSARRRRGYDPSVAGPPRSGSGGLDLAGQRRDRVPVRHALGPAARGRRHRRPEAARRCAPPPPGTVAIAGLVGGYGNYVCIQHGGALSTCSAHNTSLVGRRRPARRPGPGRRLLGLHGALLRPARPLRDAHQRGPGGPHGLPVAPRAVASGRDEDPRRRAGGVRPAAQRHRGRPGRARARRGARAPAGVRRLPHRPVHGVRRRPVRLRAVRARPRGRGRRRGGRRGRHEPSRAATTSSRCSARSAASASTAATTARTSAWRSASSRTRATCPTARRA